MDSSKKLKVGIIVDDIDQSYLIYDLYKKSLESNCYDVEYLIVQKSNDLKIKNLNPKKRPISAVADNFEVRNAKNITVKTNRKIKFNLLYDKNRSLQNKIKLEQLRNETS